MNEENEIDDIMQKLGFKKLVSNQFMHPEWGIIHLRESSFEEIAQAIFRLGQWKKTEEIFKAMNIQNLVR